MRILCSILLAGGLTTSSCHRDTSLGDATLSSPDAAASGAAASAGGSGEAGGGQSAGGSGPSQVNDCAPSPHSCGFPDATNTGVPPGTQLSPAATCEITTDGAVVDATDFACTVTIRARDVLIRRSKIHPGSGGAIRVMSGNVSLEDCELYDATDVVIQYDNWSCLRCDIHDFQDDGARLGNDTRLEDSFIHGFSTPQGGAAEGAQLQAGVARVVVRHSTIFANDQSGAAPATAALFIAPDQGPTSDGPVVLEGNLLAGGQYTVYVVDGNQGQFVIKNVSLKNNRFVRDSARYGPLSLTDSEKPFLSSGGNVWDRDGTPIE